MKKIIVISLLILLTLPSYSQNITNTLGLEGVFSIKYGVNTFLTLNQGNGYLNLTNCLQIPLTTASNIGVIYKGEERFLHNFGTVNTFLGLGSGNFTMTGSNNVIVGGGCFSLNTTGSYNTAVGSYNLYLNETGDRNSAFGHKALYNNKIGTNNTAIGFESLYSNTVSDNTAVGYQSLYTNSTGLHNTALGYQSLYANITGRDNTALGYKTLYNNTGFENTAIGSNSLKTNSTGNCNTALGVNTLGTNISGLDNTAIGINALISNKYGNGNTALGRASLYNNSSGNDNTAIGFGALGSNTSSYNTAIGKNAGYTVTTGSNNIIIGYDAQVPDGTASNQVRIGNTAVTYAGVQVAWNVTSDRRWKENILPSNLGLEFITKLNPVSYTRINDENKKTEHGLIAQEVEQVLKEEGVDNSGMITIDDKGMYELRYNDLLAPMVKSIQELNEKNAGLKTEVDDLKSRLTSLENGTGTQNPQSAGFLSGNINLNYLFLLVFSTAGFTFLLIKKHTKK